MRKRTTKKDYRIAEQMEEGVSFAELSGKWVVRVINPKSGKLTSIGQLDKKEDAEALYELKK